MTYLENYIKQVAERPTPQVAAARLPSQQQNQASRQLGPTAPQAPTFDPSTPTAVAVSSHQQQAQAADAALPVAVRPQSHAE